VSGGIIIKADVDNNHLPPSEQFNDHYFKTSNMLHCCGNTIVILRTLMMQWNWIELKVFMLLLPSKTDRKACS
jgi:hypothetical protein